MMDLARIREEGVILQVVSEWGPWSPCKRCVYYRGIKTSRGYCRLKRNINSASDIINVTKMTSNIYFKLYRICKFVALLIIIFLF